MRYLLFGGLEIYPPAGWLGFIGAYETKEAAYKAGVERLRVDSAEWVDWFQVIDLETKKMIAWEGSAHGGVNHDD